MRQRFVDVMEFWRFLLQRFFADRAMQSAGALTYTTLFAVVPMMTVTFVILSAIPAFQGMGEDIQGFIFRNFVPSSGATVQEYLRDFTVQARKLTWVGVVLLAVTAFMMLLNIEKAFNTIWRVRQPRRGVQRFLLYWAILSLGPLLLGVGFAVSTYITSLALLAGPNALIGAKTLLGFAPLLSSVAAFTLIYATVPNTRVPLRHALIGGLFGAVLFEIAKALFGVFVRLFPGYQLIYGAFATVPLFLLWIYVSWLIVLFGAELVCNLSSSRQWRRRALPKVLIMLGVLRVFHRRQQKGLAVRHVDAQREGWPLEEHEWEEVLEFLEREHLVCRVSGGAGWVLCRDLEHFSLYQLLSRSPWPLPRLSQLPEQLDEAWYPGLRQALNALNDEQAVLFDGSLAHWLRGNS
ncbi:YihY family inner membrane protein [Pseudomonas sp. Marseille-Q8238]